MPKTQLKVAIALAGLSSVLIIILVIVANLGRLVAYVGSGADPATIFQTIPSVPVDLQERVTWLADRPSAAEGRALEPYTLSLIHI